MSSISLQYNFEQPGEIDIKEIKTLIPHRYPMLLIDKLTKVVLGESAIGIKNVTVNEWFFEGHFPNNPIMPGVLVVEAMAQTAGALVVKTLQEGQGIKKLGEVKNVYFMSIEEAKFRKPVVPGDTLYINVQRQRNRKNIWRFKGEAFVEKELVAESIFTAMIVDAHEN